MSDMRNRDAPGGAPPGRVGEPIGRDPRTREPLGDIPVRDTSRDRGAFAFEGRGDEESIPELLRRLADQGTHLAQQQAKLIEAEVRSSVDDLKAAGGAMAGAAVVGIAGLGVLLMGLSFLLAEAMDLWLATLIVAAIALGGAYAMYAAGAKKLTNGTMNVERSRRTLERAPSAIAGNTNEGGRNGR